MLPDDERLQEILNKGIDIQCPRCKGSKSIMARSGGVLIYRVCPECNGAGITGKTETIGERFGRIFDNERKRRKKLLRDMGRVGRKGKEK